MDQQPEGRLELTWTNKHRRLLARPDGSYEWVPPHDYRVAEVRLLRDAETVGEVSKERAKDNLLIQGDALYALTSLCKLPEFESEYAGKVKLAYIDPPFNTQQAFEQYDDGLEHSVWLTMMRDRLEQIKKLLAPDGSVWVHLDDSEMAYCRVLMDELFGRECFAGALVWRSTDNSNNDAKQFSTDHNYLLVYSPDPDWRTQWLPATPEQVKHYKNPDNDPRGPWFDGNPVSRPAPPRVNLCYDIEAPDGTTIPHPPNGWRWSRETLEETLRTGEIRFSPDNRSIIRRTYLSDHAGLPPSSLWAALDETGHNRQAKYELKKLFPGVPTGQLFATPKPERLLRRILRIATQPGDVVLDCFLGSGTSAAVAHKMGRRWIGIEWSRETVTRFSTPRLSKVVSGDDMGGVSKEVSWNGGGGFRVLEVASSMFEAEGGRVYLADWATNGLLGEGAAAQLGFTCEAEPPFCGRKGRSRLAVIDGLVNEDVVRLLVGALGPDENLTLCGTAVDPAAADVLMQLRPGSRIRKIPSSILSEYRASRFQRTKAMREARESAEVEA